MNYSASWECLSGTCIQNCYGQDCVCDDCPFNDYLCTDSASECIINCIDEYSCKDIRLITAAKNTTVICNAPNSCNNFTFYCGTPPYRGQSMDFNDFINKCEIIIKAQNAFSDGLFNCEYTGTNNITQCNINITHYLNETSNSVFNCDSSVKKCNVDCKIGTIFEFDTTSICEADICDGNNCSTLQGRADDEGELKRQFKWWVWALFVLGCICLCGWFCSCLWALSKADTKGGYSGPAFC